MDAPAASASLVALETEGLLQELVDRATRNGHGRPLSRVALDELLEEVELPARLYQRALAALESLGLCKAEGLDEDGAESDGDEGWYVDGLSVFLRRSRHDILTAAEEVELGRAIERGQLAQEALDQVPELPEDVRRDFRRQARAGRAAADDMAAHNIRLVVHIASQYKSHASPSLEFEDLIQEGYIGLAKAIERWDYSRGLKFSTYANWWIRQTIQRAIADKSTTIRLPVHAYDDLRRILSAEQRILESGSKPTVGRIAKRVELPESKVRELLTWRNRVDSLQRLVGNGETELHELLGSSNLSEPEVLLEQTLLREDMLRVLTGLRAREAEIVRRRFGFDGTPETLEQIGQSFGLTRERIRQIEAKALGHLRGPLRRVVQDGVEVSA